MPSSKTTTKRQPEERYRSAFELHAGQSLNGTSQAVGERRKRAIQQFMDQGLPGSKNEAYKYTDIASVFSRDYQVEPDASLKKLPSTALDQVDTPEFDAHRVVLVNGRFSSDHSSVGTLPKGAIVGGLEEAGKTKEAILNTFYGTQADEERNPFIALNSAFAQDGAFVYVPRNTAVDKPIHIIHLYSYEQPHLLQPRHLFAAEDGANVRIVETHHTLTDTDILTNSVTEMHVGAEGHLDHIVVQDQGDHVSHHTSTDVYQSDDSYFSTNTFVLSGDVIRNNLHITADGSYCESHLFGLLLGKGDSHFDNSTLVDHTKPDCFSNELYKSVLDDQSTGVFNGKVYVHQDSQRINAYQSNKNILLSHDADIYSKPELEIYADDVECSHGSTTGKLDEEAIFYLRSRGLSEQKARRMLLHAFALEVVEHVEIEELRSWLDDRVMRLFN